LITKYATNQPNNTQDLNLGQMKQKTQYNSQWHICRNWHE